MMLVNLLFLVHLDKAFFFWHLERATCWEPVSQAVFLMLPSDEA